MVDLSLRIYHRFHDNLDAFAEKLRYSELSLVRTLLYTKGGTTGLAAAVDFDKDFAVWVHVALLTVKKALVEAKWL
jgi:hypothetical protein